MTDFVEPIRPYVVGFEALYADTVIPTRGTELSAGYDLHAYLFNRDILLYRADVRDNPTNAARHLTVYGSLTLGPGDRALVPCGFRATMPAGFEAQIRARSGLALKQGLVPINAPGTIDADFPGEWAVLLVNLSPVLQTVRHGDRVGQAVFARHEVVEFVDCKVQVTTDRTGGYGSTGR